MKAWTGAIHRSANHHHHPRSCASCETDPGKFRPSLSSLVTGRKERAGPRWWLLSCSRLVCFPCSNLLLQGDLLPCRGTAVSPYNYDIWNVSIASVQIWGGGGVSGLLENASDCRTNWRRLSKLIGSNSYIVGKRM